MKTVNFLDYAIIAGYFVFMLAIGIYFRKVSKSAREYFTGGSMIPWWVSGMTLYMANFSAWTFTASAGFTYTAGLFVLLYFSTGAFAYFLGTQLTAARWRRTRSISPVEYTYTRFNTSTQQLLGWVISVNFTLSAGVQLASTCKLLAPVMQLDIVTVTIITGIVILSYTFLGGVWAVSVTDVVQGVILLCTTFMIVPMSLSLVGGVGNLLHALPPLTLDHTYNGVHYTEHWLLAILLISTLGFAAGSGQRFYSVQDERSALKVGRFAGVLSLAGPFIFGIPPLVAKVIWPDLSKVEFFKPYMGQNPQDLVYIGLCLKLLPNGLIGVFVAAMLAATMSTLSAVYNMVSSIIARDMYQGLVKRNATDQELLKVGRIASIGLGILVTALAVFFLGSSLGIFNIMVAFFTLFNIPVGVPMAFGLIFRKVPKWSAAASIIWGLVAGAVCRYVLGWDIGPQVYFAFLMSFAIFASSPWIAELWRRSRTVTGALALGVGVAAGLFFTYTAAVPLTELLTVLLWLAAAVLGVSLYFFAALFVRQSPEEDRLVAEFFRKLDTPVDVQKEVFAAGKQQMSAFPLAGGTMVIMGFLISGMLLTGLSEGDARIVLILSGLMVLMGVALWYFGKKSEIRSAPPVPASTPSVSGK